MKVPPCFKCNTPMKHVFSQTDELLEDDDNQPNNGLEFSTNGHYGSTVFDPMNGDFLIINICDSCIKEAAPEGRVLLKEYIPPSYRPVTHTTKKWRP